MSEWVFNPSQLFSLPDKYVWNSITKVILTSQTKISNMLQRIIMSTAKRLTILSTGIGRPPAAAEGKGFSYPEDLYAKNKALLDADIDRARQIGYDVQTMDLNPNPAQLHETLEQLKEKLRSQHWDGFGIGFGVRANKDFTPLFEGAVNACREITPSTRMMFACAPDDVVGGILRAFPEEAK